MAKTWWPATVMYLSERRTRRPKIELSSIGRLYPKHVQWTGVLYGGIGDYESRKRLVGYRVIVDVVVIVVIVENRTFELMRESSDVDAEDRSRAGAELNQSPKYRLIVGSGRNDHRIRGGGEQLGG